jgi:hypothetical protein
VNNRNIRFFASKYPTAQFKNIFSNGFTAMYIAVPVLIVIEDAGFLHDSWVHLITTAVSLLQTNSSRLSLVVYYNIRKKRAADMRLPQSLLTDIGGMYQNGKTVVIASG